MSTASAKKAKAWGQLGRALSEREFQEWGRKQPTFLTFEDWLREEEEMRKMGSKPCPVCGTLNSVTATVCHKCGSLMRDTPRPPSGGGGGAPPAPARPPARGTVRGTAGTPGRYSGLAVRIPGRRSNRHGGDPAARDPEARRRAPAGHPEAGHQAASRRGR